MMMYRQGKIISIRRSWGPAWEYDVELTDGRSVRALGYAPLVGELPVGAHVVLSGAAYERALGTGGYMMIVLAPDHLPADPPPQPGHIVKARYTPQQFMVQGVDEQESPHHDLLAEATDISGMPVVVADLHSALPAIVAGIRADRPDAKIAYVMTDGGALPAWFSQTAHTLREYGHICGIITSGQAFGGDLEAVNVHTALLAARHVWDADIAVVAQGPGNLGTGTRWGFSGVATGEALNAVAVLGGKPIAAVRMSNADNRPRHFGISHHTMRVLIDVVHAPCAVPIPDNTDIPDTVPAEWFARVAEQARELATQQNLELHSIDSAGLYQALEESPAGLRTMGRDLASDSTAFIAAAAAGRYASYVLGK